MKFRCIFEPSDFKSFGQLLTHLPVGSDTSMNCAFCCKVGYRRVEDSNIYCLISLSDGAVYAERSSLEDFCDFINDYSGVGLRPLTELECDQLGRSLTNRFPASPTKKSD